MMIRYASSCPGGTSRVRVRRTSCFCPGSIFATGGLPMTSRWFWYWSAKPLWLQANTRICRLAVSLPRFSSHNALAC